MMLLQMLVLPFLLLLNAYNGSEIVSLSEPEYTGSLTHFKNDTTRQRVLSKPQYWVYNNPKKDRRAVEVFFSNAAILKMTGKMASEVEIKEDVKGVLVIFAIKDKKIAMLYTSSYGDLNIGSYVYTNNGVKESYNSASKYRTEFINSGKDYLDTLTVDLEFAIDNTKLIDLISIKKHTLNTSTKFKLNIPVMLNDSYGINDYINLVSTTKIDTGYLIGLPCPPRCYRNGNKKK